MNCWRRLIPLLAFAASLWAQNAPLADAVEKRDQAAIEALLKQHADVNARQPDGATALQWAVHWDDAGTVARLVRAGANVNAANDLGVTPMALACENRNAEIAGLLLKDGANPNAATSSGETVLMTAARSGNVDVVKALVAKQAHVNAKEPVRDQTALMWAVSEQHPDVVQALIEAGADVRARSRVRHRTVSTGTRYGDQKLVSGIIETDLGGFTPLLFAARVGDIESAKRLLAAGADVNDVAPNGASVLVVAAHSGHGGLGSVLLEHGADPNASGAGYTALHAAVLRGDLALTKALLGRGAKVDALLTKGTPSRYYSKDYAFRDGFIGATPLWLAARFGESEIMRVLAGAGANPRFVLPDRPGHREVPFGEVASVYGSSIVVAALVVARGVGAFRAGDRRERYEGPGDVAAKGEGEDERTALATAKTALDLGADVNAADVDGNTPLHVASALGLSTVIPLLVEKGARLDVKNKAGQTPLALVQGSSQRGFYGLSAEQRQTMAALLRKLGATE